MLSRHSVETYQGNELTRNSSGNARSQSSQLAKPLWTDPGLKEWNGVRKLILASRKRRRKRGKGKKEREKKKGTGGD